jgi:hypothetical protein
MFNELRTRRRWKPRGLGLWKGPSRIRLGFQLLESRIVPTPHPLLPLIVPQLDSDPLADPITMGPAAARSLPIANPGIWAVAPTNQSRVDPGFSFPAEATNSQRGLSLALPTATGPSGNVPDLFSEAGVRYMDGLLKFSTTDLASDAFGLPWAQVRSWSNNFSYSVGHRNGYGWVNSVLGSIPSIFLGKTRSCVTRQGEMSTIF